MEAIITVRESKAEVMITDRGRCQSHEIAETEAYDYIQRLRDAGYKVDVVNKKKKMIDGLR